MSRKNQAQSSSDEGSLADSIRLLQTEIEEVKANSKQQRVESLQHYEKVRADNREALRLGRAEYTSVCPSPGPLVSQPGIEANIRNSHGLTPLEMIFMCAINSNDLYIAREIQSAGGQTSTGTINEQTETAADNIDAQEKPIQHELYQDMVSGILIIASLMATVTFQVAMTPPGGFIQDSNTSDTTGHHTNPGRAMLYYFAKDKYTTLMITNANAFMASVLVIISLIQPSKFLHLLWPKVRFFLNFIVVVVTVEFFLILSIVNEGKLLQQPGFLTTIICWGVLLGLTVLSLLFQSSRHYMPFSTCSCWGTHFGF